MCYSLVTGDCPCDLGRNDQQIDRRLQIFEVVKGCYMINTNLALIYNKIRFSDCESFEEVIATAQLQHQSQFPRRLPKLCSEKLS